MQRIDWNIIAIQTGVDKSCRYIEINDDAHKFIQFFQAPYISWVAWNVSSKKGALILINQQENFDIRVCKVFNSRWKFNFEYL